MPAAAMAAQSAAAQPVRNPGLMEVWLIRLIVLVRNDPAHKDVRGS
jgi:hypothetical protein